MVGSPFHVAATTYIPTLAGFLYLAIVLDVFSRRVVGWAMAAHLRTALVLEALEMAVAQRPPVLPAQPTNLFMLFGARAVGALADISVRLRDPGSDGLGGRLELPSQVPGRTSGPNQLDHLLSERRRVRRSGFRHRGYLLLATGSGVRGNGATPKLRECLLLLRPDRCAKRDDEYGEEHCAMHHYSRPPLQSVLPVHLTWPSTAGVRRPWGR